MESLRQDLILGFRSLVRQPGMSLVAVVTLTLGIGANVAMVSFAGAILYPELPYEDPDRLVVVERWDISDNSPGVSYPALADWRERQKVFSDLAVLHPRRWNLDDGQGDSERISILLVSADVFSTLGMEPALGRPFNPNDDHLGADPAVVLSYELWQRRFGCDEGILGRPLKLNGLAYTVVGVLPRGLSGETIGGTTLNDVWVPIAPVLESSADDDRKAQSEFVTVCRLRSGVSLASARADMERITAELARDHPASDTDKETRVTWLHEDLVGAQRPSVRVLAATAAFLLLIVCVNLINLLLARSVTRQREFAVRQALGAGRRRLIFQGLNEAIAVALIGALAGVAAAAATIRWLPTVLAGVPYAHQARLSPSVLVFSAVLGLAVVLVIGLIPSLQVASVSWPQLLVGSLTSRSAAQHRWLRRTLVVVQIALATALLVGTGLVSTSLFNLKRQDLGYSTERSLTLQVGLSAPDYLEADAWVAYIDRALASVGSLPEIDDVAVITDLPLGAAPGSSFLFADHFIAPDGHKARKVAYFYEASEAYFRLMGIPIVEGEGFTSRYEHQGSKRVVIVSQSLAREYWPDQSAIGKEVAFEAAGGTIEEPDAIWREVIGVVGDTRHHRVREEPQHAVYVPYTQRAEWHDFAGTVPEVGLVASTTVEVESASPALRKALADIDPRVPIYDLRPLQDIVDEELSRARMVLVLLSCFAGVAVILALAGIYGVVSYFVTARTPEIGIRMVFGAGPRQILSQLLLANLALSLAGVAAGLLLAAGLSRLLAGQLYGVDPVEPGVFLGAGLFLLLTALLATLVPALRAAAIRPVSALRYE